MLFRLQWAQKVSLRNLNQQRNMEPQDLDITTVLEQSLDIFVAEAMQKQPMGVRMDTLAALTETLKSTRLNMLDHLLLKCDDATYARGFFSGILAIANMLEQSMEKHKLLNY